MVCENYGHMWKVVVNDGLQFNVILRWRSDDDSVPLMMVEWFEQTTAFWATYNWQMSYARISDTLTIIISWK